MTEAIDKAISQLREDPAADKAYRDQLAIVAMAKMLRGWRKEARLTQKALAELMGTSQSAVARLESFDNNHMPQLDTLRAFAHHCQRDLVIGDAAQKDRLLTL